MLIFLKGITMLFGFSSFVASSASSRIISNNRQLFLSYCQRMVKSLNTSSPIICASQLSCFFKHANSAYLPETALLQEHKKRFEEAIQNRTERLWCLNLADLARSIILNDNLLKKEIIDNFGEENVGKIIVTLGIQSLENLLCYAYITRFTQLMPQASLYQNRLVKAMETLRTVNYCSDQLDGLRKQELIRNLKITNSKADLAFWQALVNPGHYQRGGEPILCSDKTLYRVPDRVATMINAAKLHKGSYPMFRELINVLRTTSPLFSNPFASYYRTPVLTGIYDFDKNIEELNVEYFKQNFDKTTKDKEMQRQSLRRFTSY